MKNNQNPLSLFERITNFLWECILIPVQYIFFLFSAIISVFSDLKTIIFADAEEELAKRMLEVPLKKSSAWLITISEEKLTEQDDCWVRQTSVINYTPNEPHLIITLEISDHANQNEEAQANVIEALAKAILGGPNTEEINPFLRNFIPHRPEIILFESNNILNQLQPFLQKIKVEGKIAPEDILRQEKKFSMNRPEQDQSDVDEIFEELLKSLEKQDPNALNDPKIQKLKKDMAELSANSQKNKSEKKNQ
eukprot:c26175_g1_i1.p1 GENE.c26175_g1_i1~~c26175_g1_i1.p1  ORF type:complete len:262 (+),score=112.69 c26175_g1_i1:34-786(+)